jgi:hypothetical protein
MKTYFWQLLKLALFLPLFAIAQQANAQQKALIINI